MSDEFTSEEGKVLVFRLKHELNVQKKLGERQSAQQGALVEPIDEEPALTCTECLGDEEAGED